MQEYIHIHNTALKGNHIRMSQNDNQEMQFILIFINKDGYILIQNDKFKMKYITVHAIY